MRSLKTFNRDALSGNAVHGDALGITQPKSDARCTATLYFFQSSSNFKSAFAAFTLTANRALLCVLRPGEEEITRHSIVSRRHARARRPRVPNHPLPLRPHHRGVATGDDPSSLDCTSLARVDATRRGRDSPSRIPREFSLDRSTDAHRPNPRRADERAGRPIARPDRISRIPRPSVVVFHASPVPARARVAHLERRHRAEIVAGR